MCGSDFLFFILKHISEEIEVNVAAAAGAERGRLFLSLCQDELTDC